MKSRPKNSPLVGRSDPVAKDYKMYKAGKFWRFAFTMFAGTVIGGSMMTLPNLLPDSGIHVVKAAAGDPLSETRNSDVYNTINGKKKSMPQSPYQGLMMVMGIWLLISRLN